MGNKGKFFKGLEKDAPKFKFDFNGFGVKLYYKEDSVKGCYAEIYTDSNMLSIKVDGRTPSYGLMMQAAAEGDTESIAGYIYMCIRSIFDLASDEQFLGIVSNAIIAKNERMQEESDKRAASVTDDAEIEAQAFMESAVERSQFIGDKQYEDMASELEKEDIKAALEELQDERKEGAENE